MIQRIQTVYLALGILALLALLFFDVVWQSRASDTLPWFAPAVLATLALAVLLAGASIFMYKDRAKQRKVVTFAQLALLLLVVVFYGGLTMASELGFRSGGELQVGRIITLLLPVAAYVLFYLARRGIERDIKLIRSMDRLR